MSEPSRRAVLGSALLVLAGATGAGVGLTRKVHHKIAVPPPPPPAALVEAVRTNEHLLAGFDACLAAGASEATLAPLRQEVTQHQLAVTALLENYPGWRLAHAGGTSTGPSAGTPTASPAPSTVPALRSALQAQANQLTATSVGWPAGEGQAAAVVPLLGSIAACLTVQAAQLT